MKPSSHYREWVVVLEAAGNADSTLLELGTTEAPRSTATIPVGGPGGHVTVSCRTKGACVERWWGEGQALAYDHPPAARARGPARSARQQARPTRQRRVSLNAGATLDLGVGPGEHPARSCGTPS